MVCALSVAPSKAPRDRLLLLSMLQHPSPICMVAAGQLRHWVSLGALICIFFFAGATYST